MKSNLFEKYGKKASQGEVLFSAGEPGEKMYVLIEGVVRIFIHTRGGIEKTLALLGPGEFFGEMSVLTNQLRSATAIVEKEAKFLEIELKVLEDMIVNNTEIALRLIRKLASRLASADSLIKVLLHKDEKERIIENLKRLALIHKDKEGKSASFKADFEEMAQQVGLSCDEIKEVMLQLLEAGFVELNQNIWSISNIEDIDDFLNFLRLKEQYQQ